MAYILISDTDSARLQARPHAGGCHAGVFLISTSTRNHTNDTRSMRPLRKTAPVRYIPRHAQPANLSRVLSAPSLQAHHPQASRWATLHVPGGLVSVKRCSARCPVRATHWYKSTRFFADVLGRAPFTFHHGGSRGSTLKTQRFRTCFAVPSHVCIPAVCPSIRGP